MLKNALTCELININFVCETREEAVYESGKLLVNAGKAKESYIDAMLSYLDEYGPYIVLTNGIAMPHARPEDGAIDVGFSLVLLDEPVNFGHADFDPVSLVIGLCAVDNKSHLNALKELVDIISNEEKVKKIMTASSKQEILTVLNEK